MYEYFYGLREKPFDLHPDPEYLYMSQGHENAYTHLEYAIREHKGFVVVTGEIGSGKTTLINYLLTKVQQDMEVGLISNTSLSPEEFIMMICEEFEVPLAGAGRDKSKMIARFHEFLLDQFAQNKRVILIIDEAQNLSPEALEEIRMLSNLEAEKHHLLQTILVGQPELKTKLQSKSLEQFAQRVTVHCHLEGLGRPEVEKYIRYRLKVAGAQDQNIFTGDAIQAVYEHSRGIPRLINILCDTALVFGYADSMKQVDKDVIDAVVKARKAGGLFVEADPQGEGESGVGEGAARSEVPGRSRDSLYRPLEKRVRVLETVIVALKKRIDVLSQHKEKRDTLMLELFNLLKENLESRMSMVDVYRRLNPQRPPSEFQSPTHLQSPRAVVLSFKSILWVIIALAGIVGIAVLVGFWGP